jgi:hypothetical protein
MKQKIPNAYKNEADFASDYIIPAVEINIIPYIFQLKHAFHRISDLLNDECENRFSIITVKTG